MTEDLFDFPMSASLRGIARPPVDVMPHLPLPKFRDGKWFFWTESPALQEPSAFEQTLLAPDLFTSPMLSEGQRKLEWQLYNLALHGLEYAKHPEQFPQPAAHDTTLPHSRAGHYPQPKQSPNDFLDVERLDDSRINP